MTVKGKGAGSRAGVRNGFELVFQAEKIHGGWQTPSPTIFVVIFHYY